MRSVYVIRVVLVAPTYKEMIVPRIFLPSVLSRLQYNLRVTGLLNIHFQENFFQTSTGYHPVLYSTVKSGSFPGGKAAEG
jgi:hypothetical protein